jgi:hypothetical protein
MGIQNAAARRIAVPDLTTTVLTLTIVGMSADGLFGGGPNSKVGRRLCRSSQCSWARSLEACWCSRSATP